MSRWTLGSWALGLRPLGWGPDPAGAVAGAPAVSARFSFAPPGAVAGASIPTLGQSATFGWVATGSGGATAIPGGAGLQVQAASGQPSGGASAAPSCVGLQAGASPGKASGGTSESAWLPVYGRLNPKTVGGTARPNGAGASLGFSASPLAGSVARPGGAGGVCGAAPSQALGWPAEEELALLFALIA